MSSTELNLSEKAGLSQLARRLVERGTRAASDSVMMRMTAEGSDHFSEDGRLLRLLEVEKRIETIGHDWSKTLNAVLSTIERLEARVSRLDGEVDGLHEREEALERSVTRHREELDASAIAFAQTAATRIEEALARVDTLLSAHPFNGGADVFEKPAVTAQRG